MLNHLDAFTVGIAFVSFVVFLILHVMLLRRRQDASGLRVLTQSCATGGVFLVAVWLPSMMKDGYLSGYPRRDLVLAAASSIVIYGLLAFNYVLGWFNLGETARRIRLLRELACAPGHMMTEDEVLGAYNAQMIVTTRLRRLVAAGQLRFDGDRYGLEGRVFLTQARMLAWLKQILGTPGAKH
jgi:hypothetical protein